MLFIIQFYIHPYEDTKANYLESFVLFSLVVFLGLGSTMSLVRASHFHSNNNFTLWPLFYLPLAVGAVVTTSYIVYQIWWAIRLPELCIHTFSLVINCFLHPIMISGGGYGNITSLNFLRRKSNVQNKPKRYFEDSQYQKGVWWFAKRV